MALTTTLLLILAGWVQEAECSDCAAYMSSQPSTLSLLCPNTICQLEEHSSRGCNNANTKSCKIVDCNRVYRLHDTTQSLFNHSSLSKLPNGQQTVSSQKQRVNCTIVEFPHGMDIKLLVTCQKGDCYLSFRSKSTACSRHLGINCQRGDIRKTCIGMYHFHLESEPSSTCQTQRDTVSTIGCNQQSKIITVQSCTNEVTTRILSATPIRIPTMTATVQFHTIKGTTRTASVTPVYIPTTVHSGVSLITPSAPGSCASAEQTNFLNTVTPVAGTLVGLLVALLVVVTIGWVWTCRILNGKKRLERWSENIRAADYVNVSNNSAYEANTAIQTNLAYEPRNLRFSELEKPQVETEPIYDAIMPSPSQMNTKVKASGSEESKGQYEQLNGEISP